MASSSSMKMIAGAASLACWKRSRTREAPTPTIASMNSDAEIEKNGTPASPATALASSVLPVPGWPESSTPRGMRAPRRWYFSGDLRKSTISVSSSLASSMPATSLKFTRVSSPPSARRALRAAELAEHPPAPGLLARPASEEDEQPDQQQHRPEGEQDRLPAASGPPAGCAFTVTLLSWSSRESDWSSANAGISVSNFFASLTFFLYSPWTVSPLDEISFTLPCSTCSMKSGV